MSELQEIRVTIDEDGRVAIDVEGVGGVACLEITGELERFLGGEIDRNMKQDAEIEQRQVETLGNDAD